MNGSIISVLVIDDEPAIRKLLHAGMPTGWQMIEAETGSEGIRLVASNNPAIVLLDLGLPDMDGVEVTRRVREFSQVPIIVLSARDREGDKVAALDAGANDYVTKPFSIAELHARIRVALRVAQATPLGDSGQITFGAIVVDLASREVIKNSVSIHLTPIEFELLLFLVRNVDRVLTHKQILTHVWGASYAKQTQYLRVFMGNLRHKLEDDPARPRFFITETGVGYRFRGDDAR